MGFFLCVTLFFVYYCILLNLYMFITALLSCFFVFVIIALKKIVMLP